MRQLFFVRPELLEWRDVPDPRLEGRGDALVRSVAVASCDLDGSIVRGQAPFPGPFPLGHDFVAEILELAPDVEGFSVGDLAIVAGQICCGECARCLRGRTGDCTAVPPVSMYGLGSVGGEWGGAMSDVVRVPFASGMLVHVPANLTPLDVTSVGDNVADAWRAIAPHLKQLPGAPVLVVGGAGGGSIGLYTVAIACALGSGYVEYVDHDPSRLEVAARLGAQLVEGWPERLGPYPITVDASADRRGLGCAIKSTEGGGVCVSTGIHYGDDTPMPLQQMYMTGITFMTSRAHVRSLIPNVLDLVTNDRLRPAEIVSEVANWDDAPDAFRTYTTKLVVSRETRRNR